MSRQESTTRPRSATLPTQHDKTLSMLVGDENPISDAFIVYQSANPAEQNSALENLNKLLTETIESLNILLALIKEYPMLHSSQPPRARPKSTSVERLPTIKEYMQTAHAEGVLALDIKIAEAEEGPISEFVRRGRSATVVASMPEAERTQYVALLEKITEMFPRLNTVPAELSTSLAALRNILVDFHASLLRFTLLPTAAPVIADAAPVPQRSWAECLCSFFCCRRNRNPQQRGSSNTITAPRGPAAV